MTGRPRGGATVPGEGVVSVLPRTWRAAWRRAAMAAPAEYSKGVLGEVVHLGDLDLDPAQHPMARGDHGESCAGQGPDQVHPPCLPDPGGEGRADGPGGICAGTRDRCLEVHHDGVERGEKQGREAPQAGVPNEHEDPEHQRRRGEHLAGACRPDPPPGSRPGHAYGKTETRRPPREQGEPAERSACELRDDVAQRMPDRHPALKQERQCHRGIDMGAAHPAHRGDRDEGADGAEEEAGEGAAQGRVRKQAGQRAGGCEVDDDRRDSQRHQQRGADQLGEVESPDSRGSLLVMIHELSSSAGATCGGAVASAGHTAVANRGSRPDVPDACGEFTGKTSHHPVIRGR